MAKKYWYLATQYSEFPDGHDAANAFACRLTAEMLTLGIPVMSPIAHSHGIAEWLPKDKRTDHDFWMIADAPMLENCYGVLVVMTHGWEQSKGIRYEIDYAERNYLKILYMKPDKIPTGLIEGRY